VPAAPTRLARVRAAAAARGVPLAAILVTVGVVLVYLAGKLLCRLRDIILLMVVGGFIALILNPFVVFVQRRVPRRGLAVTIVTVWALLIFTILVVAFGYPLANGLTHLSHRLPVYVHDAAQGHGWIGHLVRRFRLTAWVNRNAPNLETLGAKLARPALTFGKGAASVVARLATVAAGIVTAAVFIGYQQLENHVLNPVVMSRTVNVSPLLVFVSILIGSSIGDWFGGYFGAFVAALLSIPCAAALQVVVREIWQATAPGGVLGGGPPDRAG
jgi:predicted PurR-regulated permease PerM